MNRSVFEGRFLVSMLGSLIRQDETFPVHRRMNWERLFRIADYHDIPSAIYLAMLGATERVPEMWGEHFFLRYQESVRYGSGYESAETEILQTFQIMKLSITVLESAAIRRLYPVAESAGNSPLRLYVPEESYALARGYLMDLGYETDRFYRGFGEHMKSSKSGFIVEIYRKLPFLTKSYQKNMKSLMDRANPDKNMSYIRTLSLESSYVFRLAETVYRYCIDELRIREILDVYLFYKLFHKSMNQKFIDARLREFGITVSSLSLLHIADMWFGNRKEPLFPAPKEDMSIYDSIENLILSNGAVGTDAIPEAQKLRKDIEEAMNREERSERLRKLKARILDFFALLKRKLVGGEETVESKDETAPEEQESGKSLGLGNGASPFASESPYGQRRRKKVFYKPHDHSADVDTEREKSGGEAAEQGSEGSSSAGVLEKLGNPLDIKEDPSFNTVEITEDETEEDGEQELLLWDFPKLNTAYSFRPDSGRERDVVLREHRELKEEEWDERLLQSEDVPRIKFTSYQAVSSMDGVDAAGIAASREKSRASPIANSGAVEKSGPETVELETEKGTGTVDGREVKFSKWKFPKIEDVES